MPAATTQALPEIIEIYHSEGSTEPKDFALLKEAQTLPQEWRRYSALLPAGAKRFAVRSCATDAFILMLDDFSYEVNGEGGSIAIRGYNVYRDGVQLNSEPVEEKQLHRLGRKRHISQICGDCSLRPRPVGPVERGKRGYVGRRRPRVRGQHKHKRGPHTGSERA